MTTPDYWAPTDPLGEALHQMRMNGAFYSRSELTAPWGMTMPAMPGHIWFHIVTSGPAWLQPEDGTPRPLLPGELALVPHGRGHRILGAPGVPAPNVMDLEREAVSDRYELIRYGGGGDPTTLICGAVRFDHPAARKLVEALPETIHVEVGGSPQQEWMHSTLRLMAVEAQQLRPGGEEVITRLGDILVIQAIRAWIETDRAARTGWLGALHDEQIGRAISLIHKQPDRDWSVASLAAESAMSRSAFADRFTKVVGEPVMQYLTTWRMNLALDALRSEHATAAQLARRLGYRSEAAFARAFKRVVGLPPGAVKRGTAPTTS
ncbi:AraC family transcriptional regulator [Jiangella aurantiaca]|uniref:AraC family transcriptional regulator n=1 Tax=Jiangella aurantiaca TaxID=2530373 RepID=A0A4R5A635_9ACTN|nr:AraC family transcriptional regulator [Jiangella aurantiaca]TDD67411.1 AraC family transcriptional regulator [Jiangella aurantiaca]